MKIVLFALIIIASITANSQQSIFYDISLKNESSTTAFNKYSSEIAKILSYKIESSKHLKKRLLQESFNTKSDTVSFIATYWCQENGVVLPYMFGSSLTRETPAHKELKKILSRFRISPKDMKKLTRFTGGDQVHLFFNYRKVKDSSSGNIRFEYFTYNYNSPLPRLDKENNQTSPVCKGCRIPKKKNIYDLKVQQKIKACNSNKIDHLMLNNFNRKKLAQHPFLKGRQVIIFTKFTINNLGDISDIKAVSLIPELETEAIRVLNKLPKAKPATVDGLPVNVIYDKSITFMTN